MKKKIVYYLVLVLPVLHAVAQKESPIKPYRFTINLNHVYDGHLIVELKTPAILSKTISYQLPKIVPGMYSIDDYGRYADQFKAYDRQGNALAVVRKDTNTWTIFHADKLFKLTYRIKGNFFDSLSDHEVFEPGGSDIQKDTVFVINHHCFLGYFQGLKNIPYELTVIHPNKMYGSTAMFDLNQSPTLDLYRTASYNEMVDNPILYDYPDTATIKVGNSTVLISIYSPNKIISSDYLSKKLDTLLKAQTKYLGGKLPVDKYAFLIYLADASKITNGQGALEHSYSSFYFLEEKDSVQLASDFLDDAAHEFFHIITPLSIHSDKIQFFDFNDPKMSEHLWLYEGSTEYHANMVQEKYGIISPNELLNRISDMISRSRDNFNDSVPMTVMSREVLGKYKDQFSNVYEKGPLIVMCLDIQLLQLSNGKYGFINLMKDLSGSYGKRRGFKDEVLFDEIGKLTYPEIESFLKTYVAGSKPLPLESVFNSVGINFMPIVETKDSLFTIGSFKRGYNPETKRFFIRDTTGVDAMGRALGYHNNDVIMAVNGEDFKVMSEKRFLDGFQASTGEGRELVVKVLRKDTNGKDQVLDLKALQIKCPGRKNNVLNFSASASPEQLKLRKEWLRPNGIQTE